MFTNVDSAIRSPQRISLYNKTRLVGLDLFAIRNYLKRGITLDVVLRQVQDEWVAMLTMSGASLAK